MVKVAVACFIGGTVGAFVALWINGVFWWLGVLLGGLLGYITYDFPQVVSAARVAFQTVATWPHKTQRELKNLWEAALKRKEGLLAGAIGGLAFLLGGVHLLGTDLTSIAENSELRSIWGILFLAYACIGAILGYVWHPSFRRDMKTVVSFIRRIPRMILTALLTLLRLIHSDLRAVVGFDAAIGAWVGYVVATPIIGGIVGAVLGVAFYFIAQRFQLLIRENA